MASLHNLRVLFFGFVWPEPFSSAAGVRTWQLVDLFKRAGAQVAFCAAGKPNRAQQALDAAGVQTYRCGPNNEAQARSVLQAARPDLVVFDRFVVEEQYSHFVHTHCPDAARVLDTQDLHSLRLGRQDALAEGHSLAKLAQHRPPASSALFMRELAAIQRSDLTLLVSTHEEHLLAQVLGAVPGWKLAQAPFLYDVAKPLPALPGFGQRRGFVVLGNFRHPPNRDAAQWLAKDVWPLIRERLPSATCHVYGAYPAPCDFALANKGEGLHVAGVLGELGPVLRQARVLLAPVRYGAGIKGKVTDAWLHGLPVCTTPLGAEGMHGEGGPEGERQHWGGLWEAVDAQQLASQAVRLHTDQGLWESCQSAGWQLLHGHFSRAAHEGPLLHTLSGLVGGLAGRRQEDYGQALLWATGQRSTEYMARWLECKAALRATQQGQGVG